MPYTINTVEIPMNVNTIDTVFQAGKKSSFFKHLKKQSETYIKDTDILYILGSFSPFFLKLRDDDSNETLIKFVTHYSDLLDTKDQKALNRIANPTEDNFIRNNLNAMTSNNIVQQHSNLRDLLLIAYEQFSNNATEVMKKNIPINTFNDIIKTIDEKCTTHEDFMTFKNNLAEFAKNEFYNYISTRSDEEHEQLFDFLVENVLNDDQQEHLELIKKFYFRNINLFILSVGNPGDVEKTIEKYNNEDDLIEDGENSIIDFLRSIKEEGVSLKDSYCCFDETLDFEVLCALSLFQRFMDSFVKSVYATVASRILVNLLK